MSCEVRKVASNLFLLWKVGTWSKRLQGPQRTCGKKLLFTKKKSCSDTLRDMHESTISKVTSLLNKVVLGNPLEEEAFKASSTVVHESEKFLGCISKKEASSCEAYVSDGEEDETNKEV